MIETPSFLQAFEDPTSVSVNHFVMIQTCTYLYSSDMSPDRWKVWIHQEVFVEIERCW